MPNSSHLNGTATRYFWASSNGPALGWATSSASGTVAGSWNLQIVGPLWPGAPFNPSTTYFTSGAGPVLTAFDGATGVVPLATTKRLSNNFSVDGKTMLVVDEDGTGVNHLIASPASAPARNVVADGYGGTVVPLWTSATGSPAFYSPDFTTVYAWGDANAGTGNPASWTLHALALGTGAIGTLGTNLVNNGSANFGVTHKYLFFQSGSDPLLGTSSYYANTVGTATATTQSDNVRTVVRSLTDNSAFVVLQPDGTSHVASAAGGAAAVALNAAASTNETLDWSLDGTRLFAVDNGDGIGFGTVWAGVAGSAGAIYDTQVVGGVMPDFTGQNLLTIAQHASDGGVVLDHASIQ